MVGDGEVSFGFNGWKKGGDRKRGEGEDGLGEGREEGKWDRKWGNLRDVLVAVAESKGIEVAAWRIGDGEGISVETWVGVRDWEDV